MHLPLLGILEKNLDQALSRDRSQQSKSTSLLTYGITGTLLGGFKGKPTGSRD